MDDLPDHVGLLIKKQLEDQVFSKFTPKKEEIARLEEVKKVYQLIRNQFKDDFTILTGGYVAFLEGLTRTFGDVDIFILKRDRLKQNNFRYHNRRCIHDVSLRHLGRLNGFFKTLSPSLSMGCDNGPSSLISTLCGNYPGSKTRKDKIRYPALGGCITFNTIIFSKLKIENSPENWLDATKKLFSIFDLNISAVALTPDFSHFVRFEPASLKLNNCCELGSECSLSEYQKTRRRLRQKKYLKRKKHLGSPKSLLRIAYEILAGSQ